MKLREQAQFLRPGDVTGSGEVVHSVIRDSVSWPSSKVCVRLRNEKGIDREALWGKRTVIGIQRKEA